MATTGTGTRTTTGGIDLRDPLDKLSLEQKVRLLTGADFWALHAEPAVGLRRMVVSDGPAGVRGETWDERSTSANVPSPTALAASWDEERVERLGHLLAAECRRKGVDVLLAPTVNLHRSPYGGRHFECFSEDPVLTADIGVAYVRGIQSRGVGATVKHFVANDSETDRFTANMVVDERPLRELYLAPFEAIVKEARVWAVMAAYNSVNGTTMTESPLLRQILHGEWGFDGVTMTDWHAGRSTEPAANAGLDLIMPGPKGPWRDALVAAVRDGRVSEDLIDDKVTRILRLAGRVAGFDAAPTSTGQDWSEQDLRDELRSAAVAGFVLVRNESAPGAGTEGPMLPLSAETLRSVAIVGPNATHGRTLGGGSALVFPPYTVSPLEGMRAALSPTTSIDAVLGVRAHTRIQPADVALLRTPDGSAAGVEVRFLDAAGSVLGTELREASAYNWHGEFGDFPADRLSAIELHTRLKAPSTGTWTLGASGLGRFRLTIDGVVAFDTRLELAPGADPVEGLMAPPQQGYAVELAEGQEVGIALLHEPLPASSSSFDAVMIAFQINLEPPYAGDDAEIEQAVALAAAADVAIVVVGTTEEVESEGFDRDSLALPGRQDELVRRVAAANPRTVVVVNAGAPVLLPWREDVPAILLTWFPGQEFGNALADVLLGVVEPGGRLPTTWPAGEDRALASTRPIEGAVAYDEGLHIGYRRFLRDGVAPAYWFGHGLGYTTWEYGDVSAGPVGPDGDVTATLTMRNTGGRRGREVVQIYLSRPGSAVDRPARWLAAHAAVEAEPGAEETVNVVIPRRRLEHWDAAGGGWTLEPGDFEVHAGRSVGDLSGSCVVRVG